MGIYQNCMEDLIGRSLSNGGMLRPEDLAAFNIGLRNAKYDSHTIFMAQNGMGKTMAALIVKSYMGKIDIRRDVIYPQTSVPELVGRITKEKGVDFLLDELAHLFPYKRSNESSQIALFSAMEVARANRNAFLGCCRDVLRINNNYRNGKAQLLVWLLDRDEESSYGSVHLGTPVFEMQDKFFISSVAATYNYAQMTRQIERLPSFIGYIEFGNVRKRISASQLSEYEELKKEGIEYLGMREQRKLNLQKAKFERREMRDADENAGDIGGDAVLRGRRPHGVYSDRD